MEAAFRVAAAGDIAAVRPCLFGELDGTGGPSDTRRDSEREYDGLRVRLGMGLQ